MIFEEITEDRSFEDKRTEIDYLENLVADAQDRLEELSEEEEEGIGGAGTQICRSYYRNHSGTAYADFYRVMLTTCPGSIIECRALSRGITIKKKGRTLWVYRNNTRGKRRIEVLSKKGYDKYITRITINFL